MSSTISSSRAGARVPAADVEDVYTLSPMQEGLLFHTVQSQQSGVFFEQGAGTLEGELDDTAFEDAWNQVVRRHSVLRSSFHWRSLARPVQIVHRHATVPFRRLDWRDIPSGQHSSMVEDLLKAERNAGFNLEQPPLMRVVLARTGDSRHVLIWSIHHLIHDSWSTSIVLDELFRSYGGARLPGPAQYRDYIAWLKRYDMANAEAFWRTYLNGVHGCATTVVSTHEREEIVLADHETEGIQDFARRHRLTPYAVVQGFYAAALHHVRKQKEAVFGRVVSGRPPELTRVETIAGPFINTVPMRVTVHGEVMVPEWLRTVRSDQLRQAPWELAPLAGIQRWSGIPNGSSVFDNILVFQNSFVDLSSQEVAGLRITDVRFEGHPNYPMMMRIWPGVRMRLETSFTASARLTAKKILVALSHLLRRLPALEALSMAELLGTLDANDREMLRARIAGRLQNRVTG